MWTKRQSKAIYDREETKSRIVEKLEEKKLGNGCSEKNDETKKKCELSDLELGKVNRKCDDV